MTGPARSRFYLRLSFVFLAIALVGFSTTFFVPLARGTFQAPAIVYVHGALLFGWLVLFSVQAWLVQLRSVRLHRRIGWFGVAIAAAIVPAGVLVGHFAATRDLATTGATWPYGEFVNIVIEMLVFGTLVGAAILRRRDPESHKRFLVLATISALGPAWFRFRHLLPFVPEPLVTFSLVADAMMLVVIARDRLTMQRVHPVYVWAGAAMFAVHLVELTASGSDLWLTLGRWCLG